MGNNLIPDSHPIGSALFFDAESFLTDLSEEDESTFTGGKRSRSSVIKLRRRRLRIRRNRIRIRRRRIRQRRGQKRTTTD